MDHYPVENGPSFRGKWSIIPWKMVHISTRGASETRKNAFPAARARSRPTEAPLGRLPRKNGPLFRGKWSIIPWKNGPLFRGKWTIIPWKMVHFPKHLILINMEKCFMVAMGPARLTGPAGLTGPAWPAGCTVMEADMRSVDSG